MAVNLNIESIVSFKSSINAVTSPPVFLQTLVELEDGVYPVIQNKTPILDVSSLETFIVNRGRFSNTQTLVLSNVGTSNLEIRVIQVYNLVAKQVRGSVPYFYTYHRVLNIDDLNNNGATIITPNSSKELDISFFSEYIGQYPAALVINSNDRNLTNSLYTIPLLIDSSEFLELDLGVTSFESTSTIFGERKIYTIPISQYNGSTSSYDIDIVGSIGYSLSSQTTSSVKILFNNDEISNVNGLYTATIEISAYDVVNQTTTTEYVSISTNVDIDENAFNNYATWLSPGSKYNSIIGISYDLINELKVLTIGVGGGADGSPAYIDGGSSLLTVNNLGVIGEELEDNYQYWSLVYRIPILGTAKTYYSKDYLVKLYGDNYGYYFGENQAPLSMFIITDDGYGNLSIRMNHLREKPIDNEELSTTLDNLTRAFFYYSEKDIEGRFYNLGTPKGDGTLTDLFAGFNNNGEIVTYLVEFPK